MECRNLVLKGDHMAQSLIQEARMKGVSYAELLQITTVALRLLKATYPSQDEVFDLTQQADAAFHAVVAPPPATN
jgi:hypothetical protein